MSSQQDVLSSLDNYKKKLDGKVEILLDNFGNQGIKKDIIGPAMRDLIDYQHSMLVEVVKELLKGDEGVGISVLSSPLGC